MFRPRKIIWLLGLALLVCTAAGAGWLVNHSVGSEGSPQSGKEPSAVEGIVAFGFVGIEPGIAPLHPLPPGRVVWVEGEGKKVHKGDVLLRLDARLAEADLKRAQLDVKNARLQLTKAELLPKQQEEKLAQLKASVAAATYDKEAADQQLAVKEKLYKDQQTSDFERRIYKALSDKAAAVVRATEAKQRELELYQPQMDLDRARGELAEKEAVVEKAELALDEYNVRAPTDGEVLRVWANVGETLGSNPRSPAIEFGPKGKRIIRAEVLQEWAAKVKPGQEAIIEDDTTTALQWRGRVTRVSDWYTHRRSILQEPFQYNDVRTVECLVELREPLGQPLRIGQRVRVTIKQGGP